ncbi:hypothetical protein AWB72_00178 [Caballeronia concitans]|uniref:Uncharacterized protein n=1 Tax=Caballeronia concitans TaxID=1777133 RepID=A0A658QQE5_9BURK|nr:hypothetical protein BurMR1_1022 [Burkholderia sp. MR1]SAL09953.1 hypothetical protein AWB72_00178 [Caballeronia concitans]
MNSPAPYCSFRTRPNVVSIPARRRFVLRLYVHCVLHKADTR